jgi:hypothetical protein
MVLTEVLTGYSQGYSRGTHEGTEGGEGGCQVQQPREVDDRRRRQLRIVDGVAEQHARAEPMYVL